MPNNKTKRKSKSLIKKFQRMENKYTLCKNKNCLAEKVFDKKTQKYIINLSKKCNNSKNYTKCSNDYYNQSEFKKINTDYLNCINNKCKKEQKLFRKNFRKYANMVSFFQNDKTKQTKIL
jgi:hypothetical protein